MASRSMNFLALRPAVGAAPALAGARLVCADERGTLLVFESHFTPLWARAQVARCTADLDEEVALQRFLGALPIGAFLLKRAGDQCGHRGTWFDHPFRALPEVAAIERSYRALTRPAAQAA